MPLTLHSIQGTWDGLLSQKYPDVLLSCTFLLIVNDNIRLFFFAIFVIVALY